MHEACLTVKGCCVHPPEVGGHFVLSVFACFGYQSAEMQKFDVLAAGMTCFYLINEAIKVTLCFGHKLLHAAVSIPLRGGVANLVSVIYFKDDCLDQTCPALIWAILVCDVKRSVKL